MMVRCGQSSRPLYLFPRLRFSNCTPLQVASSSARVAFNVIKSDPISPEHILTTCRVLKTGPVSEFKNIKNLIISSHHSNHLIRPSPHNLNKGRYVSTLKRGSIDASESKLSSPLPTSSSAVDFPRLEENKEMQEAISPSSLAAQGHLAFRHCSTSSLLVSLAVFKLCGMPFVIRLAPRVLAIAASLKLNAPLEWILRKTFFAQFCGGETPVSVVPTVQMLARQGVRSILDLSVEADLSPKELSDGASHTLSQRRQTVYSAGSRTQDSVAVQIIETIDTLATCQKSRLPSLQLSSKPVAVDGNYVALKVTSLCSPTLLEAVSSVLQEQKRNFDKLAITAHHKPQPDTDAKKTVSLPVLDAAGFTKWVGLLPAGPAIAKDEMTQFFHSYKLADQSTDVIDWVQILLHIHPLNPKVSHFFVPSSPSETNEASVLTPACLMSLQEAMARFSRINEHAAKHSIKLMYDAEQTYFQPAIDLITLELARIMNQSSRDSVSGGGASPVVFQTYQMYLVDGLERLRYDIERAKRGGFQLACKVVRGAYMVSERERCASLNLPDVIHASIEDTHASYNTAVRLLLDEMAASEGIDKKDMQLGGGGGGVAAVVIASHNVDSIRGALAHASEKSLSVKHNPNVAFAQLLGMCDYVSFRLGEEGITTFKYVPFGPVHEVIPYLLRRAQENSAVLEGPPALHDRLFLWKELKRRFSWFRPAGVNTALYHI